MKHTSRSLLTLIASLILFSSVTATPVRAEVEDWPTQDYPGCREFSSPNGQKGVCSGAFFLSGVVSNQSAAVEQILGAVPGVTVTADVWQRNPKHAQRMMEQAAVPKIGNYIAMMYANPPADLALWVRDTGQTLGFIPKQTYAQGPGVGFTGLAPLLPVWKAFRNIAYLLMAIAMIAIGFMIMLRKRIDPKTVVTVQNALPRIVVTLLLITFSYAIVGFMIDIMYLLIAISVSVLDSAAILPKIDSGGFLPTLAESYGTNHDLYARGGLFAVIGNIFRGAGIGTLGEGTGIQDLTYKVLGLNDPIARFLQFGGIVGGLALTAATFPLAGPLGLGVAGLAFLPTFLAFLVSIALLFLIIRLFIFFLGAYIQIIVALIFAPFQIMADVFPGSNAFSSWIKNLFANLIVFPVGAVIFMLSSIFAQMSNQQGDLWRPPYTPLFSSSVTSIGALLAIGILFAVPSIAGGIREALKAKPFLEAGPSSIAQSLSQPANLIMQGYHFWTSKKTLDYMRAQAGIDKGKPGS